MNLTPIVKKILFLNIGIHLLGILFMYMGFPWYENLALWPPSSGKNEYGQYISHMFLHADMFHLFFNMLVLVSFGSAVEEYFKANKFILFYILCGLGSVFLHLFITGSSLPMLGASGALFGLLVAFTLINPNQRLYLFFLVGIKAKYVITGYILLEFVNALSNNNDGIGHYAHIGGVLTGVILFMLNKLSIKNEKVINS